MREYENLVGNRYGKLIVKELLPSKGNGHRHWLCQCDCGNMHEATTGNLNYGHTTNCGCDKSPDLSGQKFGKITVIRRSDNKRKRGNRLIVEWECLCDCGNTVFRTTDQLTNKKMRMCAECSRQNSVEHAFKDAGFEQGTQVTKIREMKLTAANTSGCRGVYWNKKQKKWEVRLRFKKKLMYFGSYSNFEDAVKVRHHAEEEVFGAFLATLDEQST